MKQYIEELIVASVSRAHAAGALITAQIPVLVVEEPKVESHGDFASNFALTAAKIQKKAPRAIAQAVIDHFEDPDGLIDRIEIAGPGFINFFLKPQAWGPVVGEILAQDRTFGACDLGRGERVQVEFVSANPTGPLHVGHGRGAAVGDTLARLLAFCGYDVQREYYINDSGRQIRTLGLSVYLRCRQQLGEQTDFPQECYQGDYIGELAAEVLAAKGAAFIQADEEQAVTHCARYAAAQIAAGIHADLVSFGVTFDEWFSEQSLFDSGEVDSCLAELKARGLVYEEQGAWWFKSSSLGDTKDRVVIRQNGLTTYLASDIAYHRHKFRRGFARVIDVWGADHHGYIPRMTAAVEAVGQRREQFQVILVQLVNLLRGGEPVAMSTRAGEFVTLKEVVDEVGRDAARFIFLTRDYASPLDFDLEVARRQSNENPVYYVQYVHARIAGILRKGAERGLAAGEWQAPFGSLLTEAEEVALIRGLARYPEVIRESARALAPHRVTFYLMQLAALFHLFYGRQRVVTDDERLSRARLCLVLAVQKVIRNGLALLGVSAPERM